MGTLYDFGTAVEQIRSTASSIEVHGEKNVVALFRIFSLCNMIIEELNKIVEEHSQDNPTNQVGDDDGQVDS